VDLIWYVVVSYIRQPQQGRLGPPSGTRWLFWHLAAIMLVFGVYFIFSANAEAHLDGQLAN